MNKVPTPIWLIVAGLAALALLSIWIVDKSPMDRTFKDTAKRTIATGTALAIVGALAAAAFFGLNAPLSLAASVGILVGSGAYAVSKMAISGALTSGNVCPDGCGTDIIDGRLWCWCQKEDGSLDIFPADSQ